MLFSAGQLAHPLLLTQSYTVLMPYLLVKGEEAFMFIPLKKPTKWSMEVIWFLHFLPQNQLVHVKLTQEEQKGGEVGKNPKN